MLMPLTFYEGLKFSFRISRLKLHEKFMSLMGSRLVGGLNCLQ
jgi:hypothetical protein